MDKFTTTLLSYLPNVFAALVLAAIAAAGVLLIRRILTRILAGRNIPPEVQNLLVRGLQTFIIIIGGLTVLDQIGVNIASMVAGLGIAGLALSLAAQDTVANLVSGVAILVDRPFHEGDWIEINGMHASVTKIRLRTTILTSFDNETVVMPNKALAQTRVVNYTYSPGIRVSVPLRISYQEDIVKTRQLLLSVADKDERVEEEPAPVVWVTGLAESWVNLELRFWVKDSLQKYPLTWEYLERCKHELRQAGIQIPYPQQEVLVQGATKSLK